MTRISAIFNPFIIDSLEIKKSISNYLGKKDFHKIDKGFIGIAIDGPGGIYRHEAGILILDGLIYDIKEQKSTLNMKGSNDGDIIAERISKFGIKKALSEINGDFSIIWIPKNENHFFIARDPFGQRPLYYSKIEDGWVVSSQPSGIYSLPNFKRNINKNYLFRYGSMHYRMIDNNPNESPYENIFQLEANNYIKFSYEKILEKQKYWEFDFNFETTLSGNDLVEYYKFLLLDATRIRLNRFLDNEVAFTLSGGMDSSSILACAVNIRNKPQICYSSLYRDPTYDERDDIKTILDGYVSEWRKIVLTDSVDLITKIKEIIEVNNEPIATATWLSHYELMKAVKKDNIKVLFGGLGGDELNAGEYEYFPFHFADLKFKNDKSLDFEIEKWSHYHDHPVFRKNSKKAELLINLLTDQSISGKCLPDNQRLEKYKFLLNSLLIDFQFKPIMENSFNSYLKNRTWQDLTTETLPCCLRAQDRNGSSFGIINVLPFLDKRLVKLMFSVDGKFKIKNGITKVLLRESMKGILPEETRTRIKKTGWNAPAHKWINNEIKNFSLKMCDSLGSENIYDIEKLSKLFDQHIKLSESDAYLSHMMILWPVINTLIWQDSFQK